MTSSAQVKELHHFKIDQISLLPIIMFAPFSNHPGSGAIQGVLHPGARRGQRQLGGRMEPHPQHHHPSRVRIHHPRRPPRQAEGHLRVAGAQQHTPGEGVLYVSSNYA